VTVRRGDDVIAEFRGRSRQLSGTIIPSEDS
jgi:acyl-CoA thioesterase